MAVSPWIDELQDNPDNYLIISNGEMAEENPNPYFRPSFSVPDWIAQVLRGAQARQGEYLIQEVFLGTDVISADTCALAHADNGEQDNQLWNGSTTDAGDPSSPVCRELVDGGDAEPALGGSQTYRNLDYAASIPFVAGHMTGDVRGAAYGAWFLPVRDNVGPTGVLIVSPDPVDYGYPEDADIEWEDSYAELLGIEWADGDPISIEDPGSSPFLNKWALNFPGAGGTWVDGWGTPWQLGWPTDLPDEPSETRPEMLWFYDLGAEGEDGVDPEDIWHPMPNSAGWDGHGWTEDYGTPYDAGATAPTSDAMVAAWPDVTGTGINTPEVRYARPAVKFIFQASRFRFVYEGANPVTRQYPRDDGRGISSAPRLHPPTKAARLHAGYM